RHPGWCLRSRRPQLPRGPRLVPAVGPQARRPARAGLLPRPRSQGRGAQHRRPAGPAPRLRGARRSALQRRAGSRRPPQSARGPNREGGHERGVTEGQAVIVRAAMKPISTLRKAVRSVDMATKEAVEAVVEGSDVCAGPAAGVVGEAVMELVLTEAFLEKFA